MRLFAIAVSACCFASYALECLAEAPPYLDKDTLTAKQPAVIRLSTGQLIDGTLVGFTDSSVKWQRKRNGKSLDFKYKIENVIAIQVGTYIYQNVNGKLFSAEAAEEKRVADARAAQLKRRADEEQAMRDRVAKEAKRQGAVRVTNSTDATIKISIRKVRGDDGSDIIHEGERTESNLEAIAKVIAKDGRKAPANWSFKPNESAYLNIDGKRILTSKVEFTVTTQDGSTIVSAENKPGNTEFDIRIDPTDLHSPVLAKVGTWRVEQDISYTTQRARRPTTIAPVRGFFSNDIKYWQVYGGDEFEYTQEERSGVATAWTTVENPTNSTLTVAAIVEFHFAHLLLSHERVKATITLDPKTTSKMQQFPDRCFSPENKVFLKSVFVNIVHY